MDNRRLELYQRLSKQPNDKNLTIRISGEIKHLFMQVEENPSIAIRDFIIDRILDRIDKIEVIEKVENQYYNFDPHVEYKENDFIKTVNDNINTSSNTVSIINNGNAIIENHTVSENTGEKNN
ncbi:hypothetical protein [Veillonella sp. VA142]|uniref:hypothetical protein n=1 Tax=Veillonella sp. VA142 TaxID=741834 RepID=UPI000F8C953F|nr:hypothetical protein [Veillonella sp. VA142]